MRTHPWAVLLLLFLWPALAGAMRFPAPNSESPPPALSGTWRYLTRLEATGLALLPSGGMGGVEGYAQLTPILVVDGGEAFGLNLGAPVQLRLAGGKLGAGMVRQEDWDSLSDWGQWVHALKLGSDTSPVGPWVGALEGYSLLSGHLVRRYSNRANPDYLYSGQVRWRFGYKLYALAEGGSLLYPKPDGALHPGAFASLGLGVDNAR